MSRRLLDMISTHDQIQWLQSITLYEFNFRIFVDHLSEYIWKLYSQLIFVEHCLESVYDFIDHISISIDGFGRTAAEEELKILVSYVHV